MRTSFPVASHSDFIHRFENSRITVLPQELHRYLLIGFSVESDLHNALRLLVSGFDCFNNSCFSRVIVS